jgi:hypothetical protein
MQADIGVAFFHSIYLPLMTFAPRSIDVGVSARQVALVEVAGCWFRKSMKARRVGSICRRLG